MATKTKIEWLHDPYFDYAGATWNLFWGCTRFSPGCCNCYIFRQPPLRMRHLKFDKAGVGGKTDIVYADRKVLFYPLSWQKPLMIFPESLGDLWHGAVPIERIAEVWAVMMLAPRHIFITTTKRTRRQRNWLRSPKFRILVTEAMQGILADHRVADADYYHATKHLARVGPGGSLWPLPNVWVGTSVEDNTVAAERIPELEETPAAVRWLSCEPLTNEEDDPLNLDGMLDSIDWAVFGGESGPAAKATDLDTEPAVGLRPISIPNLGKLIESAHGQDAVVFVKQLGEPWARDTGARDRAGRDMSEWPEELRVREYPVQLASRAYQLQPDNAPALAAVCRG